MIIFYTMEIGNFGNLSEAPDVYFQLWFSIYTVRKEWGSRDPITIYTNNPNKFYPIKGSYANIEVEKAPDNWLRYSGTYGGNYGHARIPAIPELLENKKVPVLYMDPDTGVKGGSGLDGRKMVIKNSKPLAYCPELFNPFCIWDIPMIRIAPTFFKDFNVSRSQYVINNGILFYPYNDYSINISKEVYQVYDKLFYYMDEKLSEAGINKEPSNNWFSDMFSVSIVWGRRKLGTFVSSPITAIKTPLIHYYMNKQHNKTSKWHSFKDVMIKKYERLKFD